MQLTEAQQAEISEVRNRTFQTHRPTVPALEELMATPIPVLDHGFVRVIDYMGDDAAIVQAARVSYGRGTRRVQEDTGLIRYLKRHHHTTPFEMCEIKLHVKLPIFVARQWIRHRTANVNEYSARYSILDNEFYVPAAVQIAEQSNVNRQGRGDEFDLEQSEKILNLLREDARRAYTNYDYMLNDDGNGKPKDPSRRQLARELARMNLSLNFYTQWYWKCNLHNLMHFLGLRADPHAQYEIRVYAQEMLQIMEAWVPIAAKAFMDYHLGAVTFSTQMMHAVRRMLAGEQVTQQNSNMTKREWEDFIKWLQPPEKLLVPATA